MPPATPLKADVIGKLAYGSWHWGWSKKCKAVRTAFAEKWARRCGAKYKSTKKLKKEGVKISKKMEGADATKQNVQLAKKKVVLPIPGEVPRQFATKGATASRRRAFPASSLAQLGESTERRKRRRRRRNSCNKRCRCKRGRNGRKCRKRCRHTRRACFKARRMKRRRGRGKVIYKNGRKYRARGGRRRRRWGRGMRRRRWASRWRRRRRRAWLGKAPKDDQSKAFFIWAVRTRYAFANRSMEMAIANHINKTCTGN